ncbi:hypothetical protein C8Q74DRAFT_1289145 [Fomes fomentarius]|nr:hypothetical protein C8Q74DRAFT_1289145 [Fomes fomentarius]
MYDRSFSDLVTFHHAIPCKTSTVSTAIYGVLQSAGGVLHCLCSHQHSHIKNAFF